MRSLKQIADGAGSRCSMEAKNMLHSHIRWSLKPMDGPSVGCRIGSSVELNRVVYGMSERGDEGVMGRHGREDKTTAISG
jgi:hypothetical protein